MWSLQSCPPLIPSRSAEVLGQQACTLWERPFKLCDKGLSESFSPSTANLKHLSFGICLPEVNIARLIKSAERSTLKEAKSHSRLVSGVLKYISKKPGVLLLGRNYRAIERIARSCFGKGFERSVEKLGYHTLTVGVTSTEGALAEFVTEVGAAIPLREGGRVKGYSTVGYQFEIAAGANVGVALGLAKKPPSKLAGNGQGVAFGASTDVGIDVGGGIGIAYSYTGQMERYVYFAAGGLGVGLPVSGTYYRDTTVVF